MARAQSRLESGKKSRKKRGFKIKLPSLGRFKFIKRIISAYWQHLPTFVAGLIFAAVTYWFISHINPNQVKHFILPNTYLPLLLLVFLTSFFLSGFIWLNSRRGLMTAVIITILLFLQLQQAIITSTIILAIVVPLVVIELILSFIKSRS
jgi:hypothetical protein